MPLPRCCPPASANDNYCLALTPHQVLTEGALGEGGREEGGGGGRHSQGAVLVKGWSLNTSLNVVIEWR